MRRLKLELKLIFTGFATKLSFAVVLVCSLLAIYLGNTGFNRLQDEQQLTQSRFEQQLSDYKQQQDLPEAGALGYYLFGPTKWSLTPWAAMFVGQSQTAYADIPTRALALQGQIYAQEMLNPSQQKSGR
ncbi:MAG: hypothetical protein JKY14_08230 [Paraglaciecola sp.]|nr:hypothetical protein [Paraglaciecola sp.]